MIKKESKIYESDYNYLSLKKLESNNYQVKTSRNAGNWYCNNIFFNDLKYNKENNLNYKMIFIHILYIDKISNIEILPQLFILNSD